MRSKVPQKPFAKAPPPAPKPTGHHVQIRPVLLYGGFTLLVATNALTVVGLLMAPDITKLVAGKDDQVYSAYEDRISQLRLEVDRLQSRHYAQAGDINLQLQELAQQQEVLVEQHQYVKELADKAAKLGIEAPDATAAAPAADDSTDAPAADAPAMDAPAPDAVPSDGDAGAQVAAAAQNITQMMDDSRLALAALSDEASSKTDQIMGTLATVGIKPKLPTFDEDAEGGPLLPPVEGPEQPSLIDDANGVAEALERYAAARDAAAVAPIHRPIATMTRISSIFGNRKDPFTGRLAFHSGLDFAAPQGTTVLSAGAGTVSFVGQISGYGNVVEVTHADGLITRYGHLSAFIAKEGDVVETGTPIARVGSTGRSTGPHLHFEVRRSDNAVDPARYLNAGKVLQKIFAT